MEKTKLTIRVTRDLIEGAKRYASQNDTTLTRLISEYLRQLTAQSDLFSDDADSDGDAGDEPPADVKKLFDLYEKFKAEPDAEKRMEIENQMFDLHNKNLWVLTVVKQPADHKQMGQSKPIEPPANGSARLTRIGSRSWQRN